MNLSQAAYYHGRQVYLAYLRPVATGVLTETDSYNADNFWTTWWHDATTDDAHSIERDGADQWASETHYRIVESAFAVACHRHDIEPRDATVVDVGTGAGRWLDYWGRYDPAEVLGIDIAESVVEALQDNYAECEHIDVQFADVAESIPRADDSVDVLSAVGVMFHLTHESRFDAALAEIERVLAPNGHALLTGSAGWLSYDRQYQDQTDSQPVEVFKRLRSRREWRRRCREAGLRVVDVIRSPTWADVDTPENNVLVVTSR